jgi:hypothetical protein
LLDHVIVLGEGHARRLLRRYAEYYNSTRTHLSLAKDSPDGRAVSGPEHGPRIVSRPILGGPARLVRSTAAWGSAPLAALEGGGYESTEPRLSVI